MSRRRDFTALLTAAPAVLIVSICCVLPLAWMAATVIANPSVRSEFSLTAFRAALLWRTVKYNGWVAIIATTMGLPAGFVLGRGRGPLARVLWVVLPAALLMPSLSFAYGWAQFVRLASTPLGHLLGLAFKPGSAFLKHKIGVTLVPTETGGLAAFLVPNASADKFRCIWSLAAWLWAVPAGLIGLTLRRMDSSVQQQAVLDGALRRVTLRQLLPPIVASLAIVTVLATQEFAVYEPTGISVVATEVRMVFDTGSLSSANNSISAPLGGGEGLHASDQPARAAAAVATTVPLLAVTILLAALATWGARAASATDAVSLADWPPVLDASRWTVALTVALVLLNIGLPVWALLKSLKNVFSLIWIWNEFGPQLYGAMFVAACAAALATVVALSVGGRWIPGALAVAGASFLIGGQLLAIALIRLMNRPLLKIDDWVYNTAVLPMLAYVGRFGWLAVAAGRGTWTRPWRELREMAGVDGAGNLRTTASVVWPIAWPTLLAGGLLVGALSLTEVPATVLLMPQNPQVLTPHLMTWLHMARSDPMIEASLLMMFSVLIPALLALGLTAFGIRRSRRAMRN